MAIAPAFFSSKELSVGVGIDASNVGTTASSFENIEVDSVTFPTFNDVKIERRSGSGSGIMTATTDMFHWGKGATIEGSVSGYLTDELVPLLISNVTGVAVSSNAWTVDGTSTSNFNFEHGDSSPLSTKTLTFAYNGVGSSTDDCVKVPGCVITSLTLSGDPNDDGGRMKFDASWTSRTPIAIGSTYASSATSLGAFSENYCYLSDYHLQSQIANADVLLKSFSLTIDNPVTFGGFGGVATDGTPQTYVRSVPGIVVTANPVVKYDANVAALWEKFRGSDDGVQAETLAAPAFEITDNDTPASGSRAISIADATVTEMAWDEGDYLGVSVTLVARGDTSTSFYLKHA